jgi:hypothetical protein
VRAYLLFCRGKKYGQYMKLELPKLNTQSSVVCYPTSVFCILSSVLTNKPNVKDAQMNVSSFVTSEYVKLDIWLNQTNKPNQTQLKPKQTQFKPKQTQFKPKQTQLIVCGLEFDILLDIILINHYNVLFNQYLSK